MLDSLEAAIEKVKACLKEKEGIDYSDQVIRNWIGPSHRGEISKPQGYAEVSRSCGDGMAFYLRINEDRIVEARFTSEGCIGTIASGNMAAVLAEGNTVYDAFDIEEQAVMDALGGLPKGEEHCAELACAALRQALRYYLTYRNDPWKRSYPEPR